MERLTPSLCRTNKDWRLRSSKANKWSKVLVPGRGWSTLLLILVFASCGSTPKPARTYRLPANLREASGLSIDRENQTFYLHNDSGDGPNLYAFSPDTKAATPLRIPARAIDWEDLTDDGNGTFYIADTGNNYGRRSQQTIYRHTLATGQTDSLAFTYPGQTGTGRNEAGNYDCEAIVYAATTHDLHLFTKAMPGKKKAYWAYHFVLPAEPGQYVAQLVDSLYLPRRTITAASLDEDRGQLVLLTYNYKRFLGVLPVVASSLITLEAYPPGRYFRGTSHRRNVSWGLPVQYEAVDFYDDRYLYLATEKTILRRQGLRRLKRK